MPLVLLIFTTFVCALYYYVTRTFNYWKGKNVNGPKPLPFFGNAKTVFFRKQHIGMLYNDIYKQYPEEKVVGLYRMTSPTLLIRDLDIAKQVLVKEFESCPDRGLYYNRERLGDNLFHSDVKVMKNLKKHFTPFFTISKLKNHMYMLVNRADKFIDYVENITMKEPELDILPVLRKYFIDSVMVTSFGLYVDVYKDDHICFDSLDAEFQTSSYLQELELLFPGILSKCNLTIFSKRVVKFCQQIIQAGVNLDTILKTENNNLMNVMLGLKEESDAASSKIPDDDKETMKVTDDMLAGQVFVFYLAGYANNALLTTYAMYHLAENPDVQERLIKEIDEVLQKHDGELTYEALKDMEYLQMVFNESLRMHPLTNAISRNVVRDFQVDGADLVINKNTVLVISPYSIQNDEKYYPEPEKFKPERFLPENVRQRHPCAMLSFGLGPRSCLGSRFAPIQFGACMVKVFSKFRVECTENTVKRIEYSPWRLLLNPSESIYLRLVHRER